MQATRVRTLAGLSAALAVSISAPTSAAECRVPTFQTVDNQIASGTMTTTSNSWCSVSMGAGTAGISDPAILKKPKNGEVLLKDFRVYYRSKKGFVGQDSFTYTRTQNDRYGGKAQRTVDMTVNVVP